MIDGSVGISTREQLDRWRKSEMVERKVQANMLRDIFGNPFRPVSLNPVWLTWHDGLLVSMAQKMYDSRDFGDMPVLADALEDAGCQDQDILGHCRSGGQHVRGCWVVDLVLGTAPIEGGDKHSGQIHGASGSRAMQGL